jgi:hypothetical protein
MSFIRPELAERLRQWREPIAWGALLVAGVWVAWRGYARLDLLLFAGGLIVTAAAVALLRAAVRRVRLQGESLAEGVVMIDEARIAYFGPRGGGFVLHDPVLLPSG